MRASPEVATPWRNRFVWLTAAATLLLICSGGMVTSKGVGLAVPDWPTTFGYNMFLFPASRWVGGIFFEHVHRLIASSVGFFTIILAAWFWRAEERRWVRNLAYAALVAVILQGVIGGLRVTLMKDEIGIFHACLAQAFLASLVILALVTTRFWQHLNARDLAPAARSIALATTVTIYLQLALGATMRHEHRDLAILDFPLAYGKIIPDVSTGNLSAINQARDAQALSDVTPFHIWLQMTHRFVALFIAGGVTAFWWVARKSAPLARLAWVWILLLCAQITLGAWTVWSNKAADIATAHVAVGASILALGVIASAIAIRLHCEESIARSPQATMVSARVEVT